MAATTFGSRSTSRCVTCREQADAVRVVIAKILIYNIGSATCTIMRTQVGAPTVGNYHWLIYRAGILDDFLECVGNISAVQSIDGRQIQVGTRSHTAIGGIGMVIGHGDRRPVDNHTRAARSRTGMGTMVLTAVIGGGRTGTYCGVLVGRTTVINIGTLNARITVFIFESDVLEINTRINDTHDHSSAVILFIQPSRISVSREVENIINICRFTSLIGVREHWRCHFNSGHHFKVGHLGEFVNGDKRREQSVIKRALNNHAFFLKRSDSRIVTNAYKG